LEKINIIITIVTPPATKYTRISTNNRNIPEKIKKSKTNDHILAIFFIVYTNPDKFITTKQTKIITLQKDIFAISLIKSSL
jgi:hypothetical protein